MNCIGRKLVEALAWPAPVALCASLLCAITTPAAEAQMYTLENYVSRLHTIDLTTGESTSSVPIIGAEPLWGATGLAVDASWI